MTREQLYASIKEVANETGTLINVCSTLTDEAAYLATPIGDRTARRLTKTTTRLIRITEELLRAAELLNADRKADTLPYDIDKMQKQLRECMTRPKKGKKQRRTTTRKSEVLAAPKTA